MGAKAPEKLKLRRQSCKCEVCGRKFLNIRALTSHRKFVHKTSIDTKRVSIKKPPDLQAGKVVKKKVDKPTDSKLGAQTPPSKVMNKNNSKVTNEDSNSKKLTAKNKIEFKCPKCVKVFSVYFTAYKHIQKNHCVDKNDKPVPPNSSDLIRPIRVEMHDCCNKTLPASDHVCTCTEIAEDKKDRYMCLGCQKTFDSLLPFEQHVKVLHTSKADCLYFTSKTEFTAWKTDLEAITKIQFQTLAPSVEKSKQTYHCSHVAPIQADKTLLCPSSLIITELTNGCQVTYFKEHFGHTCLDLPPLQYSKNSILPFLKDIEIQHIDSDQHVYQQLKSIMNNVILSAAKVDMSILYSLLDKALTMTLLFKNEGEVDHPVVNKSMTDDQITEVLTEVKTYPSKRKADTIKKDVKQNKNEEEKNENLKEDTLIDKPVLDKTVAKKAVQSLPSTPMKKPFIQSSPSFNDTYKDFVDQNFKSVTSDTSTPKRNTIKKKAVVKTKMGQFKVRPSLSPKGSSEATPSSPIKADNSPKTTKISPTQIDASLLVKRTKPSLSPKRMKPSLSPKKPKPAISPKTPINHIEYKIKPDFKYEVKEQENDCNILILKI